MNQKDNEGTVGVETVANLLKLTPRRVQQLSNEGIIPRASRGKYKVITAVWGYIDYLKTSIDYNQPDDLKEVNLRIAKHKARLMELEVAEKSGELVRVDHVISTWAKIFGLIKQSAMALPVRMVPQLMSSKNINEAVVLAKEYIENFLNEHSNIEVLLEDESNNSRDGDDAKREQGSSEQSKTSSKTNDRSVG